jgi:hypothetical protein
MFINLKSSLLGVTLLTTCMVMSAADPGIKPLDVKESAFLRSSHSAIPVVCKSAQQLAKVLGEKVAKRVELNVDFATQDVLVFKWSNSGSDKFEILEPKKPKEPGATWKFVLTKGNTKALIPDIRAYAVSQELSWHFESRHKSAYLLKGSPQ